MLVADLAERRGSFELAVDAGGPAGATTVLVGESGAGKTSILGSWQVSITPIAGAIKLDGDVYVDTAAGVRRRAWARDVGYVAQDFSLFPHLTVFENVAFGLRAGGVPRDDIASKVEEALARAGIADLSNRLPVTTLGRPAAARGRGACDRSAAAAAAARRAAVGARRPDPAAASRRAARAAAGAALRHDLRHPQPVEALVFGDQIVVVEEGRISQAGSREELLRRPRSRYVAELIGTNLFVGRWAMPVGDRPVVRTSEGVLTLTSAGGGGHGVRHGQPERDHALPRAHRLEARRTSSRVRCSSWRPSRPPAKG